MRQVTVVIPEDKLGHFYKVIASYFEDEQPQPTPEPETTVIASEAPAEAAEAPSSPASAPLEAAAETGTPEAAPESSPKREPARKTKPRAATRGRRTPAKPSSAKAKAEAKPQPSPVQVSTKYAPLVEHLDKRGENSRTYTFTQFEKVLGFPLPASARTHRAWWANSTNHAQARAWMQAGWRAENLDLDKQRVTFTRTAAPSAPTEAPAEAPTAAEAPAAKPKSTRTRKPAVKRAATRGRGRKEQAAPQARDKYAPLAQALSRADQQQVEFTFQELEEEHGIELPFDARSEAGWWANSEAQEQSRAWLEQGYRADDVDLDEGRVRFKRA